MPFLWWYVSVWYLVVHIGNMGKHIGKGCKTGLSVPNSWIWKCSGCRITLFAISLQKTKKSRWWLDVSYNIIHRHWSIIHYMKNSKYQYIFKAKNCMMKVASGKMFRKPFGWVKRFRIVSYIVIITLKTVFVDEEGHSACAGCPSDFGMLSACERWLIG